MWAEVKTIKDIDNKKMRITKILNTRNRLYDKRQKLDIEIEKRCSV